VTQNLRRRRWIEAEKEEDRGRDSCFSKFDGLFEMRYAQCVGTGR